MTDTIHLFQAAGLGLAPFRLEGMCQIPSTSLAEANPTAYNAALRMLPQGIGIGSCAYCGTPLTNNFLIRSRDGRLFPVGSECVRKTGDRGLTDKVKVIERERRRAAREEERRVKAAQAEAKLQMALQAERERNGGLTDREMIEREAERVREAKVALLAPLADAMRDGRYGFRDSVAHDMTYGHLPSGRGRVIVQEILAKLAGRRGSKACEAEYERIGKIFDQAEAIGS